MYCMCLAHTTQFVKVGWYYLQHGSGVYALSRGGSMVSLVSADDKDLTVVIETMVHFLSHLPPSPPLDNIRVMVIVWRLRGNIIRTALCWIVWHNVRSLQHTYTSNSYRSNTLDLSHWDPYAVHKGSCLELYYCNMVEWFWWDSSLILTTNCFPSVLWHCWFGHLSRKIVPKMTYNVLSWTLSLYTSCTTITTVSHLYINNRKMSRFDFMVGWTYDT